MSDSRNFVAPNRLTLCFSKKLEKLQAAFALFAAYYNFCWQTWQRGTSGKKRPTAAMMAHIAGHVWSFDELLYEVLEQFHSPRWSNLAGLFVLWWLK